MYDQWCFMNSGLEANPCMVCFVLVPLPYKRRWTGSNVQIIRCQRDWLIQGA